MPLRRVANASRTSSTRRPLGGVDGCRQDTERVPLRMDRAREPLRQTSPAQHALDRVRRFGDVGALAGRRGLHQWLNRVFELAPCGDGGEHFGEQVGGVARRYDPRPVVEHDPAPKAAIVVRGAARLLADRFTPR